MCNIKHNIHIIKQNGVCKTGKLILYNLAGSSCTSLAIAKCSVVMTTD